MRANCGRVKRASGHVGFLDPVSLWCPFWFSNLGLCSGRWSQLSMAVSDFISFEFTKISLAIFQFGFVFGFGFGFERGAGKAGADGSFFELTLAHRTSSKGPFGRGLVRPAPPAPCGPLARTAQTNRNWAGSLLWLRLRKGASPFVVCKRFWQAPLPFPWRNLRGRRRGD